MARSNTYIPTAEQPAGASLMRASLVREGDEVCFRMASANYLVEEVETDAIGHVRHRADDGARTCGYHPGELLWVRRPKGWDR